MPNRIYAEIDPATNEKRWYSTKGMGVEYVRSDDWWCETCRQRFIGGTDVGCSRASCPTCGYWMVSFQERENETLRKALTDAVDLLDQPAYREVAGSEDERSDYLRTVDGALKALGRYIGSSDYDDAPTDPHHGGKIWER